jgi:hypothetical protein
MDTATIEAVSIDTLREAVRNVIREYAGLGYSIGEIEPEIVFDDQRDRYLLMAVGWDNHRVHGCVIHVDIINGKCWVQQDGTEQGVAVELERHGVPKSHIVLAFKRPATRRQTDYAVE